MWEAWAEAFFGRISEVVLGGFEIALGGLRGPRGHLDAIWAPFGGVLGVNVGSKIACFRSLLGGTSGSRMSKKERENI